MAETFAYQNKNGDSNLEIALHAFIKVFQEFSYGFHFGEGGLVIHTHLLVNILIISLNK